MLHLRDLGVGVTFRSGSGFWWQSLLEGTIGGCKKKRRRAAALQMPRSYLLSIVASELRVVKRVLREDIGRSFPTAFTLDAPAVLPNSAGLKPGIDTDSGGALQYFASQSAAISAVGFPFAGGTGTRNAARDPGFSSVDMGLWRSLRVPKYENQRVILRLDTFNTFNHPVFNGPNQPVFDGPSSTTLANTGQFGNITSTASTPRVLQVALRYEF